MARVWAAAVSALGMLAIAAVLVEIVAAVPAQAPARAHRYISSRAAARRVARMETAPQCGLQVLRLQQVVAGEQSEPWQVKVALVNSGSETIYVFTRSSVLDAPEAVALFTVQDTSGQTPVPLSYVGMHARRTPPKMSELIAIEAGAQIEASIDLSKGFLFEEGHSYTITLDNYVSLISLSLPAADATSTARLDLDALQTCLVVSSFGSLEFTATTTVAAPWNAERKAGSVSSTQISIDSDGSYQITSCSSELENKIMTSVNNAKTGLATDADYMSVFSRCLDPTDYVQWFGTPSDARVQEVTDSINNAKSKFNAGGFNVVCGGTECTEGTYAYVFPSDPEYDIFLCSVGQQAPDTLQENSQPGTLIHEMMHFINIGATQDYVYGVTGASQLAITDPDQAVDNSDSYEYFTEFVPECTKLSPDNCYCSDCILP